MWNRAEDVLWCLSLYALNVPLCIIHVSHAVYITAKLMCSNVYCALIFSALSVAGFAFARHPHTPKGEIVQRDVSISSAKGVCILLVGVIHSASPEVLDSFMLHRTVVNNAVPVLFVYMGCTAAMSSTVRTHVQWYVKRAHAVVPRILACLVLIWLWKHYNDFVRVFRFVGGRDNTAVEVVTLSYLCQPGCIGGAWFITVYAQSLVVTPFLHRWSVRLLVPSIVASLASRVAPLEVRNSWASAAIPYPCDGNGFLHLVAYMPKQLVFIVYGICHVQTFQTRALPRTTALAFVATSAVFEMTRESSNMLVSLVHHVVYMVHVVVLSHGFKLACNAHPTLAWFGDRSFDFFLGHMIALNFLMKDFTMDTYILPLNPGIFRSVTFWFLSCGCGFVVHKVFLHAPRHTPIRVAVATLALYTCFCAAFHGSITEGTNAPVVSSPPPPPPPFLTVPQMSNSVPVPVPVATGNASRAQTTQLSNHKPYAYFTLIRGGEHSSDYNSYISRCRMLRPYINDVTMDDIAFHEGNVPDAIRDHLSKEVTVRFVDVRPFGPFAIPPNTRLFPVRTEGSYSIGYRHMCRFFALQWMHILKGYRVVMRIDEDVLVHTMQHRDPFSYMEQQRIVYGYALETREGHDETVMTMQPWINRYTSKNIDIKDMYFTNVFISRVDWWLRDDVQKFLQDIDDTQNIYLHRWGDAPIQTAALKLHDATVKLFMIDYSHGSTSNEIRKGREVRTITHSDTSSQTFNDAVRLYEKVAPCLVVNAYGLGTATSETAALDILRGHIMLETGLPKGVVDNLKDIAQVYQLDVRRDRQPLPHDSLQGIERLHAMARSVGSNTWTSDEAMHAILAKHRCAGKTSRNVRRETSAAVVKRNNPKITPIKTKIFRPSTPSFTSSSSSSSLSSSSLSSFSPSLSSSSPPPSSVSSYGLSMLQAATVRQSRIEPKRLPWMINRPRKIA